MTPSFEAIQLLTERSDWVRALARKLVHDDASADDVAQEAAIEAMRSAGSARRIGPGWLAGIVRNVASGVARRERRRSRHERGAAPLARGSAPGAADAAAFVEQQRLLADAVLGLDARFREVVLLRFFDGKPPREIARDLDIPVATVNSRLTRALAKLRARLDRDHGGDRGAWVAALAPIALRVPKAGVATIGGVLVMKKLLGAACIAAMFATGAWLVASRGSDGDASNAAPVTGAVAAAGPTADGGARDDEPPIREPVREPVTVASPAVAIDGPFVQVVDAVTGEPVPEADVREVGPSMYGALGEVVNPIERAFVVGTRLTLDERARLPLPGPTAALFARAGARVGHLYPQPGAPAVARGEPTTLRLWPLQTAVVTVRDQLGQPVEGVPVALRLRPSGMGKPIPYSIETTDDRGIARLQWYSSLLEQRPAGRARVDAALAFAGGEGASSALAEQPDGQQDLTLVCPAIGTARVRVTQNGAPVADGTRVFLGPYAEPASELMTRRAERTKNGMAEFWPVGVGVPLRAGSWLKPLTRMFETRSRGVMAAGATTDLSIDIAARCVELRGRIVDANGEPRARFEFHSTVDHRGSPGLSLAVETDADGRFVRDAVVDDQGAELALGIHTRSAPESPRVPFVVAPGVSHHDLGDIVVARRTPLVRGRVVDADGGPIMNALVSIVAKSDSVSAGWRDVSVPVVTGPDGRFEAYGPAPREPSLWITARLAGKLRHEPVPWRPGATEVELVMEPPLGIAGRLAAAAGIPFEQLEVAAWNEQAGVANEQVAVGWDPGRVDPDGTFDVGGLRAGSYTLDVRLSGGKRLARIPGVRVTDRGSTDSRLQPCDIGDAVELLELRVTDERGPVIDATAVAIDEHGSRWTLGSTTRPLLVPASAAAVRVSSSGYFSEIVPARAGAHDITLRRGTAVDVRVAGLEAVPDGYLVRVRLRPIGGAGGIEGGPSDPSVARVDPRRGGARPRVRADGEHAVELSLFDPDAGVERPIATDPPPTVAVAGLGASVRVRLDPAAVATTVREMSSK